MEPTIQITIEALWAIVSIGLKLFVVWVAAAVAAWVVIFVLYLLVHAWRRRGAR